MKQILVQVDPLKKFDTQFEEIFREYRSGRWQEVLFHIYSAFSDEAPLKTLCLRLLERFPGASLVGTISSGEICHASLMSPGILVSAMFFEKTRIRVIRYEDIKGREREAGQQIRYDIDAGNELKAVELILPGTEFNTRLLLEEISRADPSVKVFGGYAGGHFMEIREHFIFNENGLTDNQVHAVFYEGSDFHIDVDKSVGWQTLGHGFFVTKADESRLIEINHRPAVEVYQKYLQIERDENFAENTFEFPLIVKVKDDELLRHTMNVEEDGTLDLAGYVTEGMKIYLCFGNPSLIVTRVNERIEEVRKFCPQAILLYSCFVRKCFWESFVDMEMLPFETLAPTAGFHTLGEVKRNPMTGDVMEYNITLLSIAMREGDPPAKLPPAVCIDDSVLKGQASLIKRLTTLVAASTTELQNAYNDLEKLNEQLTYLSDYDTLTGIFNRRKIESMIQDGFRNAAETGRELSLVMMDIDFFKSINDSCGHAQGDIVLAEMAGLFRRAAERIPGAQVGRWGGEEFFALLPDCGRERACSFAEEVRKEAEAFAFTGMNRPVTVSLGVVTTDGREDYNTIFKKVDGCLYEAKESGRNRVCLG